MTGRVHRVNNAGYHTETMKSKGNKHRRSMRYRGNRIRAIRKYYFRQKMREAMFNERGN